MKIVKSIVALSAYIMLSSSCYAQDKPPSFIDTFAKELAANSLSYVENSHKNEHGDYVVNVVVADRTCSVTVVTIEVEHKSLDGEISDPLYRPTASNIVCKPKPFKSKE